MDLKSDHDNLKQLSDMELLGMVKNDSIEAFEELYHRHWKKLYTFAYKRIRSKEITEEIVQDFLANLWAGRKSIVIKTSFEGYIYTAVRNLVLNCIAKETRRNAYTQFVKLFKSDEDYSTEQTVHVRDFYYNLQKELSYLPEKCRSVFEMSRHENKSNKEIAAQLGISEKTVEGHLTKAIRRLRINLNSLFF
ncbi:RNA polymerase sigma-70 factor [Mucilaginibacter sp. HMF5004]|uniref:RNA polymerase sigma-70 factor n=1 Tax=Mucilaginibacter rivuli TaxID=2857527 RepID=UPI001C5EAB41|nr:RNA polymerase sigma-70 factor [Mucilaginibacter rivuli]MBW4889137.1 RNA polymerase sigma-70 factor [Mucilaginibacter rivuli]